MKISYATPGGAYSVLGDESDRSALFEDFTAQISGEGQIEPLAFGSSPFIADRGNETTQVAVTATITYASQALALAAIETIAAIFRVVKHLKIEHGATVLYVPHCQRQQIAPRLVGVTVIFRFSWIGKAITPTAP